VQRSIIGTFHSKSAHSPIWRERPSIPWKRGIGPCPASFPSAGDRWWRTGRAGVGFRLVFPPFREKSARRPSSSPARIPLSASQPAGGRLHWISSFAAREARPCGCSPARVQPGGPPVRLKGRLQRNRSAPRLCEGSVSCGSPRTDNGIVVKATIGPSPNRAAEIARIPSHSQRRSRRPLVRTSP